MCEMCCGAECAAVDLGQAEDGVVGGDDDVRVADEADAASDAEAVDGDDHRYLAVVDGGECGGAPVVGGDQGVEPFGGLHFLDVHTRVEASALGAQDHRVGVETAPGRGHGLGQVEPGL